MKFMIVVLAIAKCVLAAPEADPQLIYNAAPIQHFAGPLPLGLPLTYANAPLAPLAPAVTPLVHPAPIIAPVTTTLVKPAVVSPNTYANTPAGPLSVPAYHPHACVTPGGCAVRTLKNLGLARKKRESDPQLLIAPASTLPLGPYGLSPYGVNPHLAPFAGPLAPAHVAPVNYAPAHVAPVNYAPAHVAPAVAPVHYAPALPAIKTVLTAPAPAAVPLAAAPVPAVAPLAAAPVEHVKHVVHAPVPVVQHVQRVVPAPAPVVVSRSAIVKPVVAQKTKKVTYTHLGAHPINPTTVLETDSHVIGHTVY